MKCNLKEFPNLDFEFIPDHKECMLIDDESETIYLKLDVPGGKAHFNISFDNYLSVVNGNFEVRYE